MTTNQLDDKRARRYFIYVRSSIRKAHDAQLHAYHSHTAVDHGSAMTATVDALKACRNKIMRTANNLERARNDLVMVIPIAAAHTGRPLTAVIQDAGISRQSYYPRRAALQAVGSGADECTAPTPESAAARVAELRSLVTQLQTRLLESQSQRTRLIAALADAHPASTLASAGGVTPTWVRQIYQNTPTNSSDPVERVDQADTFPRDVPATTSEGSAHD
jgi:hypothetical protein